jgi:hypothetical protein
MTKYSRQPPGVMGFGLMSMKKILEMKCSAGVNANSAVKSVSHLMPG